MINEEEYAKLMATLERIEKAGTLADIVRTAPDPSWEDTSLTMPTIYGEDSFERIHRRGLTNMAFALQRLEKEAGMVKYFEGYCKNLYENYKSREKEIKHPDILKFIKDYEAYYKGGGE
jgi:hypothetical protein